MTTTTSTTSGSSIANTLGIGSGLDISTLVTNLSAAEKAPQEALITTRETANQAKVSSLATISNSIDSFASALSSLVAGGTLFTQPSSTNTATVGVSAIAGTRLPSSLAATLQVNQLAQGQTLVSPAVADKSASVGTGTLTLTMGSSSATITIDSSNSSLTGLAAAITGAGIGLTASVVADGTGQRLVVKGGTGAASAFTISAGNDATPDLAAYAYDPNTSGSMTRAQTAQDASLTLDGVSVTRPSNTISDLVSGVKLQLKGTGTVSIGASQPTDAITEAVNDFVSAYNEVKSTLDTATASSLNGATAGPFTNDSTIRDMQRKLAGLTSTPLVSSGSVTTLADIGVKTGIDGTLSVDSNRLSAVMASDPDGVAALFNPTQTSSSSKVQITSAMGAAAPGTYQLTDIVAGPPPSGKINGVDMLATGSRLIAPPSTGAIGLIFAVNGDVSSASVTVEAGLGGALKSVRDQLRASSGPLQGLSDALTKQATTIAADRTTMETRADAYQARLQAQFTAMNSRVTSFKATQSYLEQQIKVWTNDTSS